MKKPLDNMGFITYNIVEVKIRHIEENIKCRNLKSYFMINRTGASL